MAACPAGPGQEVGREFRAVEAERVGLNGLHYEVRDGLRCVTASLQPR